ncbi:unnamed protein product [Didymodactylos carnosus]|uniref:Uncharacterized protein n=1 Tax=Didymodactylos carnosus TaxID=1234261 RepID=A0A815VZ33_9BILA|nr:unnamed protein product [Didymodactylos carnosus]CAF4398677.1 unnamed protein product [Didymodactylos carnosus]
MGPTMIHYGNKSECYEQLLNYIKEQMNGQYPLIIGSDTASEITKAVFDLNMIVESGQLPIRQPTTDFNITDTAGRKPGKKSIRGTTTTIRSSRNKKKVL